MLHTERLDMLALIFERCILRLDFHFLTVFYCKQFFFCKHVFSVEKIIEEIFALTLWQNLVYKSTVRHRILASCSGI